MSVNLEYLLYSLANTFSKNLGIKICKNTKKFITKLENDYNNLLLDDKLYFSTYAIKLTDTLIHYLPKINFFEINLDDNHKILHNFRLKWKNDNTAHISMLHNTIDINNIIPEKLMKICGYNKNTNISKEYSDRYGKISKKFYKKFHKFEKYSSIDTDVKNKYVFDPICKLFIDTLSKKRKCADKLYDHLFSETNRIVLKLYKNRFVIYDFGVKLEPVTSFQLKQIEKNQINIKFNNNVEFLLNLQTNGSEIKQKLSIKYRSTMINLNELFSVANNSI